MSDPITPVVVTVDPAAVEDSTQALERSADALKRYGDVAQQSGSLIDLFNKKMAEVGISLTDNQSLTEEQATKFGLLTLAVGVTKKSFDNLAGIDVRGMSTFKGQIEGMISSLGKGNGAIDALTAMALNSFGKVIPDSIKGNISLVKDFVLNLAESADNGMRLQNAYVQLAGKTGNLGQVFNGAGDSLGNMNALLSKQQELMASAGEATGALPEEIHKYWAELGTVPKALDSVIASSTHSGQSISMLTATIKLATGGARNYSEVVQDLHTAFKTYNITGSEALQFTARMSEIASKYGTDLDDVRRSLLDTAGAFKMFGNEAEGAARMMNSYMGALKSTGLSGASSIEIIGSLTKSMAGLSIAQKGFLSAQTGGPGGLMGGFQIEKMMNEGKIDEVFEKIRTQMQKQFGKIVSVEEAANSPQAAAQLVKQRAILKQGPLGNFAKDDQTATKILDAFRAKQEGRADVAPLSETIVNDQMDRGTKIQEQSYTELTKIRALIAAQKGQAEIAVKGTFEEVAAARTGTKIDPNGDHRDLAKDNLRQNMKMAASRSGTVANDHRESLETGQVKDKAGEAMKNSIGKTLEIFGEIPSIIGSSLLAAKSKIMGSDTKPQTLTIDKIKEKIEARKEQDANVEKAPKSTNGISTAIASATPAKTMAQQVGGVLSGIGDTIFGRTGIPTADTKANVGSGNGITALRAPAEAEANVVPGNGITASRAPADTKDNGISKSKAPAEYKPNNISALAKKKATGTGRIPDLHQHAQDGVKAKSASPAKQVQQAVAANGTTTSATPEKGQRTTGAVVSRPTVEPPHQKVHVEITGYCVKCKNEIAGSRQSHSTSAASGTGD